MKRFLVGMERRNLAFDYSPLDAALRLLRAQRVSMRVWLCNLQGDRDDALLALLRQCVSPGDEIIIAEFPAGATLPEPLAAAA